MNLNFFGNNIQAGFFIVIYTLFFSGSVFAEEYEIPIKNPYMNKYHWSVRPNLKEFTNLSSESKKKFLECGAYANRAGGDAENLYDQRFRENRSMDWLVETLPRNVDLEGYQPEPKRSLEPWSKTDSGENLTTTLQKRTLDLTWGYYKDYEKAAATSDKTSVAQQVMWDFCLTIPKEMFAE